MRILCVCLGNICRSPMAEGTLRAMGEAAGLALEVDSAGTSGWHIGEPPQPEGLAAAAARGYDNSAQRARQVSAADFHDFDLILAMDRRNLAKLESLAPPQGRAELRLFHPAGHEIPDPYGEGPAAYERTLDLVETAARALIAELAAR
ncbi:low molecular weight protein-tyrosine-phosphatase [Paralimibaculum aggregatum]|uniref:protein-tyrosine-phosphatase n=1 Tax=Paralimibaculum aggregatum TaxID=3036245 RepID=A0ABQ6LQF0_9RHOB|nr:low molecular weight protein-tyrosine-phosphatase [Limibaculum sp. NKW23]GMG84800.1 low molecular weight protein-tyrosine-phosphatase [Limibaculum sp. NKW23]